MYTGLPPRPQRRTCKLNLRGYYRRDDIDDDVDDDIDDNVDGDIDDVDADRLTVITQ